MVQLLIFTTTKIVVFGQTTMAKSTFIFLHNTTRRTTMKEIIDTKTTVEFPFKAAKKTPAGKFTPGVGGEQTAVTTTSDAKADVQIQVLVNECDIPDRTRHSAC